MSDIVYLNVSPRIQSTKPQIAVEDVAQITGRNQDLINKIKKFSVYSFKEAESTRRVLSQLKIIEIIGRAFPSVEITPLGSSEVIIEYSDHPKPNRAWELCKVIFVSAVSFFGTGFTIMAFHNDIGIRDVFAQISSLVTGTEGNGMLTLETAYSLGLAAGIIVFFNHVGRRRITHDPTPIEVSMRKYEDDVNMTLAEVWDREGNTIDVS